jgi:hypothetical protein
MGMTFMQRLRVGFEISGFSPINLEGAERLKRTQNAQFYGFETDQL